MPVTGRSIAGLVALTCSAPICRLVGLTDDPRRARKIGVVVSATDAIGVLRVVGARSSETRRRAAHGNVILDLVLASALVALGARRRGTERFASLAAAAS